MKVTSLVMRVGIVFVGGLLFAAEAPVDLFMGDWQGKIQTEKDGQQKIMAQVFPMGKGTYRANILAQFDARVAPMAVLEGTIKDGKLVLAQKGAADQKTAWVGTIADGTFAGNSAEGAAALFSMKKEIRLSPTLGAKPPKGAVVLLGKDTQDLTALWQRENGEACGWKLLPEGVMTVVPGTRSIISKQKFKNHRIHLEFRTPYEPEERGQGRGNSGVYFQGRYEVQVLDSYGLEGKDNDCGGIYSISKTRVNMSAPPLQWQTYDATLTTAVMEGQKVVTFARITVLHNGAKIHEDLELTHATTAAPFKNIEDSGGLYLQDHGHAVQYRNIWVEELP